MRSLLIPLLLSLSAAAARAETITPIAELLKNKKAYDRIFSCIAGTSSVLFTKVSHHGHPYFTVFLSEGDAKVKVFAYGQPPFKEGEKIEACGVFTVEKHHSSRIFFDQFNAKNILRGEAIGAGRVVLSRSDVHLATSRP